MGDEFNGESERAAVGSKVRVQSDSEEKRRKSVSGI
jgi:hypothetical protein